MTKIKIKSVPWYKMYNFVKNQPEDRAVDRMSRHTCLIAAYLKSLGNANATGVHGCGQSNGSYAPTDRQFDTTLHRWFFLREASKCRTFGEVKESMDAYMDNRFRLAGFKVYLPTAVS